MGFSGGGGRDDAVDDINDFSISSIFAGFVR
jgi:hypothetical protein